MGDNISETAFSHVLQRTGVLKNFSIAKTVPLSEIEKMKRSIKKIATSEEEFEKLFSKKLAEAGNMHDPKNPIPGMIFLSDEDKRKVAYMKYAEEWAKKIKTKSTTKEELTFLIKAMVKELGLTQEDFDKNRTDESDDNNGEYEES